MKMNKSLENKNNPEKLLEKSKRKTISLNISIETLIKQLLQKQIILIGESHGNTTHGYNERKIIDLLPKNFFIGLECTPLDLYKEELELEGNLLKIIKEYGQTRVIPLLDRESIDFNDDSNHIFSKERNEDYENQLVYFNTNKLLEENYKLILVVGEDHLESNNGGGIHSKIINPSKQAVIFQKSYLNLKEKNKCQIKRLLYNNQRNFYEIIGRLNL